MKGKVVTEKFDHVTGELITTERSYSKNIKDEDRFFMAFSESFEYMLNNSSTDIALLFRLCFMTKFNEPIVEFTTSKRKETEKLLKVSRQGLSNSFNKLKKKKLISGSRDEYIVNPNLFWKGTTNGRSKYLKENRDLLNKLF